MVHTPIQQLQPEVFCIICSYLTVPEIYQRIARTSKKWHAVTEATILPLHALRGISGVYMITSSSLKWRHMRHFFGEQEDKVLAPCPEGEVQKSHAATVVFDRRLYRFGGRWADGARLNTCEVFDPMARVPSNWTQLHPMRCVRSACGVGVVRCKAYVIGGCDDNGAHASYEVFDLTTNQWVGDPQPMPIALCEHSVAAYKDCVFVVGGCIDRFQHFEVASNRILLFQPLVQGEGQWQVLPALLPTGIILGSVVIKDDFLFVAGGGPLNTQQRPESRLIYCRISDLLSCTEANPSVHWMSSKNSEIPQLDWNTFATAVGNFIIAVNEHSLHTFWSKVGTDADPQAMESFYLGVRGRTEMFYGIQTIV